MTTLNIAGFHQTVIFLKQVECFFFLSVKICHIRWLYSLPSVVPWARPNCITSWPADVENAERHACHIETFKNCYLMFCPTAEGENPQTLVLLKIV